MKQTKAAIKAIRKLKAQSDAATRAAVKKAQAASKTWDAKCLKSFLEYRPFEEGVDPDIHRQVLLITASTAASAGISAGHAGRFAARLYDTIEPFVVKARRYDQMADSEE